MTVCRWGLIHFHDCFEAVFINCPAKWSQYTLESSCLSRLLSTQHTYRYLTTSHDTISINLSQLLNTIHILNDQTTMISITTLLHSSNHVNWYGWTRHSSMWPMNGETTGSQLPWSARAVTALVMQLHLDEVWLTTKSDQSSLHLFITQWVPIL